jgi:hypothetical protein
MSATENIDEVVEPSEEPVADEVTAGATGGGGVFILLGVVLAVSVLSFLIAFTLRGGFAEKPEVPSVQTEEFASLPEDPNAPTTAPVVINGAALPEYDLQAAVDPAVGLPAPEVTGVTFLNTTTSIKNDGRAKVIVMLSHYSPVAGKFIIDADAWLQENPLPDDVDVYGVSTKANPEKPNFPPATWLRVTGWPFLTSTIVDSDNNEVNGVFGGPGVPFFIVVDAAGNVVTRQVGNVSAAGFGQLITAAQTGSFTGDIDRFEV